VSRGAALDDRAGSRAGVVGTVVLHAGLAAALLVATQGTPPTLGTVYQVRLVAAPAPTQARRVATEAVAPPPPRTAPTQTRTTRTVPATPAAPPRAEPRTEPAPRVASPVEPLPGETPGTGTSIVNVNIEGRLFPFPEYLNNIVEQVYRRWSRPALGTPLRAEVAFTILRDGTVRDIKLVQGSRNYAFDLDAVGAIENAALARAFGPLPGGFVGDALPVTFYFAPRTTR